MTDEKLITRIQKLLKLAEKNTNPAESESAWAKVQELVTKHQLNLEALREEGHEAQPDMIEERVVGASEKWQRIIVIALAEINDCEVLIGGKDSYVLGASDDVHITRLMTKSITAQVRQFGNLNWAGAGLQSSLKSKWLRSYCWGMAKRLVERIQDLRAHQPSNETALVHVRAARTEAFVNQMYPDLKQVKTRPVEVYTEAMQQGRVDGDRVQIQKALAA